MKLLREPLVHFLCIGAAIYLAYGLLNEPVQQETGNTLTVTAGEIEWLETAWQKRWMRPPTPAEREGLIQQYVRETILYREALAMGLDRDDTVIRRRLAQKLEFLSQDLVALTPPSEDDLQRYFNEHPARYETPALMTFTQVFVDPDKRGDATLKDAEKIKALLQSRAPTGANIADAGDPFMLQRYYPEKTEQEIQKLFGSGFTASLAELSIGAWQGPVLSGYGTHLVYVHHRQAPQVLPFADVRERVAQDWEDDKRREFNERFYASLRDRYHVIIEDAVDDDQVAALPRTNQ